MSKHKFYRQRNTVDCQAAYDCLSDDEKETVDTWVKRFTAGMDGNAEIANCIAIRNLGEKGAFELVMKLILFVVAHDRMLNRRGADLGKLMRS